MTRHLLSSGAGVPGDLVKEVQRYEEDAGPAPDVRSLASAHARLSRLVAPARPGAILYYDEVRSKAAGKRGVVAIPLVRSMILVALASLAVFIVLSLFHFADAEPNVAVVKSDLLRAILGELFWMSAAGLGATFGTLFQINERIASRTYDPGDAPHYWIKVFLGVIAGFILVALIPIEGAGGRNAEVMAKPTLAMLGGFSASVAYLALTRLVEAVESVFRPDSREQAATRRGAATAENDQAAAERRMEIAGRLLPIQQMLVNGTPTETVARELRTVVDTLLSGVPAESGPGGGGSSRPAGERAARPHVSGPERPGA